MASKGQGIPQDYPEAEKLFRLAADKGHARAQIALCVIYQDGERVPQDYSEARKWYRLAADHGDAVAQFALGTMEANGQGAPKDLVSAHMWFNLSAATGNKDAARTRDFVAQKMTSTQIAEAQRLAREWKPLQK
jgi:uncharacterized protein